MIIVEIAGFLGSDPEDRHTATGKRVITLRVAARVRQGGRDETVWWRVNIWGDRFDNLLPHLKKGSAVIIIGEMAKPETYVGKDGQTQISLTLNAEMVKFSPFGRPDRPGEQGATSSSYTRPENAPKPAASREQPSFEMENELENAFVGDDLPF